MQIKVTGLGKTIRGSRVLNNISFELTSGHIYGFVGKNGSGKTMLLRALTGLLVPTDGTISVNDKILHKDISFPPKVGLLIEKPEFLGYMSGLKNLKLLAEVRKEITDEKIMDLMTFFELDPHSKKSVHKYSQGMKQKLGIIQAIMEDPELLVLDEAFNALDENSVFKVRDLLLKYKNEGKLIVITSHNKEDIEVLCDTVFQLVDGEIKN